MPFTSSSGRASPAPSGTDIAAEIGDLEADIAVLYDDYRRSALPASRTTWCFTSRWAKTRFSTRRKRWAYWNFLRHRLPPKPIAANAGRAAMGLAGLFKSDDDSALPKLLRQCRSLNAFLGTNIPNFIKRYVNFQAPPRSGTLCHLNHRNRSGRRKQRG
ncbi:MAG: hypothetical protein U1E74_04050 [Paenacidovorax caeni]